MGPMNQENLLGEKAVRHFRDDGYNCSQSVLLTMFEHWNCKNELVPKVATAFGGGIGRCGLWGSDLRLDGYRNKVWDQRTFSGKAF